MAFLTIKYAPKIFAIGITKAHKSLWYSGFQAMGKNQKKRRKLVREECNGGVGRTIFRKAVFLGTERNFIANQQVIKNA